MKLRYKAISPSCYSVKSTILAYYIFYKNFYSIGKNKKEYIGINFAHWDINQISNIKSGIFISSIK